MYIYIYLSIYLSDKSSPTTKPWFLERLELCPILGGRDCMRKNALLNLAEGSTAYLSN